MKFDLHVHSQYSKDSLLKPETIIKVAKKRGLDGIAVTDHNTIRGGLEAEKINHDKNFTVIVGSEIKTEYGDVIGLYLKEEVKSKILSEVIEEIKSQNGLCGLAHPYRQYKYPEKIIDKFDFIEAFNARSRREYNLKTHELLTRYNKPISAGSDAHLSFEVGAGQTVCQIENGKISLKNTNIIGQESNYLVHCFSVLIEKIKGV